MRIWAKADFRSDEEVEEGNVSIMAVGFESRILDFVEVRVVGLRAKRAMARFE